MTRTTLLLATLLLTAQLSAQDTKGAHPVNLSTNQPVNQTRAVVVGISDYQDPAIPDLRFADRDAEAFAAWLRSPAGGNVPGGNIQLLVNAQATGAAVAGAIDWLVSATQAGDAAIIYFSGHGDVERQAHSQPGFFLCWDSGPRIYMAGGTYSLYFLQEMMSAMSAQNQARVLLIADACRSGKLAGSAVNGAQLTAANLARQFENEIKILSCQPNEYSLEGEQWGGGRGAFSFHLLEGLTGLADANQDTRVQLLEIGRYLEDHVLPDVAPLSQVPMAIGSRMETIAEVDAAALADLVANKKKQRFQFSDIGGKTLEPASIFLADSSIRSTYVAFEQALKQKRYFEPEGDNAELYYQMLISDPLLSANKPFVTRKYAVALQDDAQQSINALLKADSDLFQRTRVSLYNTFQDFPKLLHRAADLLGESHYMYKNLKAREYLFEGVLLYFKYKAAKTTTVEQGHKIAALYEKSLALEPELAVAHFFMSLCYAKMLNDPEAAKRYALQAVELAGSWIIPYTHLAYYLAREFKQFDIARQYLDMGMAIDSADAGLWKSWTAWYTYQGKIAEALEAAQRAALLAPNDPYIWLNIGILKQSQYKFDEAETILLKSIELDSSQQAAYYYLARNYYRWKKYDQAETCYLKSIELDPENELARSSLASFYIGFDRYGDAEAQYLELIKYTDPDADTWLKLAYVSTQNKHPEAGLEYLEHALKKGFANRVQIEQEAGFAPLRSLPGYPELMRRYFQD